VEPFEPALYDSREVPGVDEIAIAIRLVYRDGYDEPIDPCEEQCLREIRLRFRSLGVRER
jgi:hypothetical protein